MPKTSLRILAGALALFSAAPALAQNFDDTAEYERQRALLAMKPNGPEGQPWAQWLGEGMVETAKYKKDGAPRLCFSNAGIFNPWRVVGMHNMEAEVEAQGAAIASFTVADAEGKDDKQISDIEAMLSGGNCDVLIVSPNTTAALTPVVEKACGQLPVIVFDRGVDTKCPVTFIQPVGGYGFGITSAEFMASKLSKGAKVLAIRIVPGVDVLETRYSAAKRIFDAAGIEIVGAEFTGSDRAKTKAVVEDSGLPYPVISGEDQQDFLRKWQKESLTAIGPSYPTYQWRTPIIAAVKIAKGEPVPGPVWSLPQPAVTQETLAKYVDERMPPLHYALCGCEGLPGYPERWGGKAN